MTVKLGPHLLGEPPKINVPPPEAVTGEDEESSSSLPAIKIYDDDINLRFLVCGDARSLVIVSSLVSHLATEEHTYVLHMLLMVFLL